MKQITLKLNVLKPYTFITQQFLELGIQTWLGWDFYFTVSQKAAIEFQLGLAPSISNSMVVGSSSWVARLRASIFYRLLATASLSFLTYGPVQQSS